MYCKLKHISKATLKRISVRQTVRFLGSKELIALLNIIGAGVALFNAIENYNDSRRKIGFRKK